MKALIAELGHLPEGPVVETGGGGRHRYFKCPADLPFNKTTFGPGVDVLGDNSYVVAPPSKHSSGKRYSWRDGRSILDIETPKLPAQWLARLSERVRKKDAEQKAPADPVPHAIPEGQRNTALTSEAGRLRVAGRSVADIEVELQRINKAQCQPPLSDAEVVRIAQSAANWPAPLSNAGDPELVARRLLDDDFTGGAHLRFERDGSFYAFEGTHWRERDRELLKKRLQAIIKAYFPAARKRLTATANEALSLLMTETRAADDALHFANDPPPVINVLNGEIWLRPDGSHELRRHDPRTGCRHVLPITYDPKATCPLYSTALSQVFAKAENPARVIQVWHQLTGYIIQPRRMTPLICILLGSGGNGKSKLIQTIEKTAPAPAGEADRSRDVPV